MLNGHPLNGAPLNGTSGAGAGAAVPPVEVTRPPRPGPPAPIPVDPVMPPGYVQDPAPAGFSFIWRAFVVMGGVDVSGRVCADIRINRPEGGAAEAEFSLAYQQGEAVPANLQGAVVTVDYQSQDGGDLTQERRFTGVVTIPSWDPRTREMRITASDRLQNRIEETSVAGIDALTPTAFWSADVFEPLDGRSRWDYLTERMRSVAGSLDISPTGQFRLTSWLASPPVRTYQPGSTIFESVSVDPANLDGMTTRFEIEADYRFARLWQKNQLFGWQNPLTEGYSGEQGFCMWYHMGSETPDVSEVESAVEGTGQTIIQASYERVPPTGIYCNPPVSWINNYPDLVLSFNVTAARRWTQYVTEHYTIALIADEAEVGGDIQRESVSFEIESERAERWESDPVKGGNSGFQDLGDETRRRAALECLLQIGQVAIIGGHRGTRVSWAVPTSMAFGVDLIHSLRLEDQGVVATGKVIEVEDRWNVETGEAVTQLTIAVMRGGRIGDALLVPGRPATPPQGHYGPEKPLVTQLGRHRDSGVFDENADGFSGNYNAWDDFTFESFPRRLQLTAVEIPEERRDEQKTETSATYRVGFPNDTLEL